MPKESSQKSPFQPILIGLLASALLISIPAILSIRANRELAKSFHWVQHTLEVKGETQRLLTLLTDAETGNRGFLLFKRDTYLEPYHAALRQIPEQLRALQDLTSDNPVQQKNFRELNPLVTAKLERMGQSVALQQSGTPQEGESLVLSEKGKQLMDDIRSRLAQIDSEETRLLAARQRSLSATFKTNSALLIGLIVLNAGFAGVMLVVFRRLQKVRNLVTICAWSHKVQYQNEWIPFEEFLSRRFKIKCSHGISPAELDRLFTELDDETPNLASQREEPGPRG